MKSMKVHTRKVHMFDEDEDTLLCGKAKGPVLGAGGALGKGDVVCRKCAVVLLVNKNVYADRVNALNRLTRVKQEIIDELLHTLNELQPAEVPTETDLRRAAIKSTLDELEFPPLNDETIDRVLESLEDRGWYLSMDLDAGVIDGVNEDADPA